MFMSSKDTSKGKEESKEEKEIVAPKGFSTTKSKEERLGDDLLLEPTKLPGKKIKKNKAKKQTQVHQGAHKVISQQREFKINTLLGALSIEPPEDASQYQEKLDELKKLKEELEKNCKEELQEKIDDGLNELESQRKEEEEARERGERPRGGRGRGRGEYRGGRGGGRGSGRGNYRGGRGGGYKGRKYSDDEDNEDEERDYNKQKKEYTKQHYQNTEEGNWPELGNQ